MKERFTDLQPLFSISRYALIVLLLASCAGQQQYKRMPVDHTPARMPAGGLAKETSPEPEKVTPAPVPEAFSLSPQQLVIREARSFVGVPYKWGGTTRNGMDCSGLLVCSFKAADIALPRVSTDQANYGKAVSMNELQPGDLVFFATQGRGRISHVGMVTEVRGRKDVRFIHASTKLGVVEANLFSDYYRKIYVKARRPF